MENSKISLACNRWHHALAQITGGLVLRMVKHTLKKPELLEWAGDLKKVAEEMETLVAGKELTELGPMRPKQMKL